MFQTVRKCIDCCPSMRVQAINRYCCIFAPEREHTTSHHLVCSGPSIVAVCGINMVFVLIEGIPAVERQPALLRILPLHIVSIRANRFHMHYRGQPVLLNQHYTGTSTVVVYYTRYEAVARLCQRQLCREKKTHAVGTRAQGKYTPHCCFQCLPR